METRGTFVVQLVRTRQKTCGRTRSPLQTLKKMFRMHIRAGELAITVPRAAPSTVPTSTSSILRYFAPVRLVSSAASRGREGVWLHIEAGLVKSVKVKGRMLKVVLQGEEALM